MEKKQKQTFPYPIRFTTEELEQLDALQESLGLASRAQVVRRLIAAAYVRPGSVKFERLDVRAN